MKTTTARSGTGASQFPGGDVANPDDVRLFLKRFALRGRDPAIADENLYRYCFDSPTDRVDPTGREIAVNVSFPKLFQNRREPQGGEDTFIRISATGLNRQCDYHWIQFMFTYAFYSRAEDPSVKYSISAKLAWKDQWGPVTQETDKYYVDRGDPGNFAKGEYYDEFALHDPPDGVSLSIYDDPFLLLECESTRDALVKSATTDNTSDLKSSTAVAPASINVSREFDDFLVEMPKKNAQGLILDTPKPVAHVRWTVFEAYDLSTGKSSYSYSESATNGTMELLSPKLTPEFRDILRPYVDWKFTGMNE